MDFRVRFRCARWMPALPLLFASLSISAVSQKTGSSPEVKVTTPANSPDAAGFPVKDQLTLSKCGGCHAPDAKGNMTRISYIRTTPEGGKRRSSVWCG